MENNTVSIIMAAYNAEKYITSSIECVLAQTWSNWELLIINDCSSDNTLSIITDYSSKDERIKFFNMENNSGPAACRNLGFREAAGKYITILDSDDIWFTEFIAEMILYMDNSKKPFVFSSYLRVSEDLSKSYGDFIVPEKVNLHRLLKSCPISALTMIYDSSILGKHYMDDFEREDVTLWIKLLQKTPYAYGNKKILAKYRICKNSRSRNKLKISKQQWRLYHEYLEYNLLKSFYYIVCWSFKSFIKYYRVLLGSPK